MGDEHTGGSWVDDVDMVNTLRQERNQMFFCLLAAIVQGLVVVTMTVVLGCSLIRCRSSWAGGIHPHLLRSVLPPPSPPLLSFSLSVPLRPPCDLSLSLRPSVLPSLCPSLSLLRVSLYLCVSPCVSPCVSLCLHPYLSMRVSLCVSLCLCVSASLCLSSLSLCLSFLCLCRSFSLPARCTRGRFLRQRLPTSLFGASIDGSGSSSTDAQDHTSCVVRGLMLPQSTQPPHVCHRQNAGLSPLAGTRSWTWSSLKRSHIWTHRFLCLTSFTSEYHDPQNCRKFFTVRHQVWVSQRVFSVPSDASCT